jgi:uncharacterized membrane protein
MNNLSSQNISIFLSVLLSGLLAGLFYGYSCSVNGGLGRLSDLEYLKAMQSINKVILNPVFFLSFMGTLLILPIATWLTYSPGPSIRFYLLLAAAGTYLIGVFVVTMAGNVPLNDALENFNIGGASMQELSAHREKFESHWNNFHLVRTLASIAAFALTILSAFKTR